MMEGAFLPIRLPREPGNEVAKYKQILMVHMLMVLENDDLF